MRCYNCGANQIEVAYGTHDYTESGLEGVRLRDVERRKCAACGDVQTVIPDIEGLHRLLARELLKTDHLSGKSFRFLRKHLGWSSADVAKNFDVDVATVSRWENGKQPVGPLADRLMRMCVAHFSPIEDYTVDELAGHRSETRLEFTVRSNRQPRWAPTVAA